MPLLWVSISFLMGLVVGRWVDIPWVFWFILVIISLSFLFLNRFITKTLHVWFALYKKIPVSAGLLLLLFAFGGFREWFAHHPVFNEQNLAFYNNKGEFELTGWVSSTPDRRENMVVYTIHMVEIEDIDIFGDAERKPLKGLAQVRMPLYTNWQYGDLLIMTAKPTSPADHADFSYKDYLAIKNVHSVIYFPKNIRQIGSGSGSPILASLYHLRDLARLQIFKLFPQPESGLLIGILLGNDQYLPESLSQDYRDTGTSHIIAISGFNFSILALVFLFLFKRLSGPYWGALIMTILLITYTLMIHTSSAVIRALIMAIIAAGGHLIGRRQVGLNALMFTAAVMCLFNPLLITDICFQLSFAATFGLVVFAQPLGDGLTLFLEKILGEKQAARWSGPLAEYFLFTLVAQLATLPVIASHFGRISMSALVANPLVLPVQPAVLILGGLSVLAAFLHPVAGRFVAFFTWPFIRYTNFIVDLLSQTIKGSIILHPIFSTCFTIFCLLFLLFYFARHNLTRFFQSKFFHWSLLLLSAAIFTVVSILIHRPDGKTHIHLIRAGDEAAILLRSPHGNTILIDPSGEMNELSAGLARALSPWAFRLDAVFLTRVTSSAHLSDLAEQIKIQQFILSQGLSQQQKGVSFLEIPNGIKYEILHNDAQIQLDENIQLSIFTENPTNTAILIKHGSQHILIPNGVDPAFLRSERPDWFAAIQVLVLGEEDVAKLPIRVWNQMNPGLILWKEVSLSPFNDPLVLNGTLAPHLVSDGSSTWILK